MSIPAKLFSLRRLKVDSAMGALLPVFLCVLLLMATGCSSTKHLGESQLLLRRSTVDLNSDRSLTARGPLLEALTGAIVQVPNDYALTLFPYKLWLYNARYERYQRDTANYQLRSGIAQPPVIFDSSATRRSAANMRGVLFGQGYFYGSVVDTVLMRGKKASVVYKVNTGPSYLIDTVILKSANATIDSVVRASMGATLLPEGEAFAMVTLDLERRRISEAVRNAGYYKFSPENISYVLDTVDRRLLQAASNPFEAAMNFIAIQRDRSKPKITIRMNIRGEEDPTTLHRFMISSVTVFPDYEGTRDLTDPAMIERDVNGVRFRYHALWLKENIIYRNLFLDLNRYFSQNRYDRTVTRLGELGVFQSVRVFLYDDDTTKKADPLQHPLRVVVLLTPAARYDLNGNFEASSGSTYDVGSAASLGLRNRNLGRGANALNLTVSGGVEFFYRTSDDRSFVDRFYLRSRNLGVTAAIEFPKFIAPISNARLGRRNFPRTILSLGTSFTDRKDYFTLINTSANFAYNWRQNRTVAWDFAPAFINVQQLRNASSYFDSLRRNVPFIGNSYKNTFIEGQNLTFTFSNSGARRRAGYSYIRAGVEEAGFVLSALRSGFRAVDDGFSFQYEQYGKLDMDARHYVTRRHSTTAVRLYTGIGLPYGGSSTLPYIKQYFVGGANSIRGWRVRTLGPGSSVPPNDSNNSFIDRTGDIKLEGNLEYRFDIAQLFAGAVKIAGATFVDGGNIWLAREDTTLRGGEFAFRKLGTDVAISTGAGIRLDFGGFLTARVDIGIPIKVPYDRNGDDAIDGWVFDQIKFGDPAWRKLNLIPQVGIGYPF